MIPECHDYGTMTVARILLLEGCIRQVQSISKKQQTFSKAQQQQSAARLRDSSSRDNLPKLRSVLHEHVQVHMIVPRKTTVTCSVLLWWWSLWVQLLWWACLLWWTGLQKLLTTGTRLRVALLGVACADASWHDKRTQVNVQSSAAKTDLTLL